jgi:CMP-N-acetylneuraminic acid synthetase
VNGVVAIITARGGSKGILRKNLRELAGKPLIQYTFDAAKKANLVDEVVLSTDDEEIADLAIKCGVSVPFLRPKALATDEASSRDVLIHALARLPGYAHFVLLQPTSPLRTTDHIDEALEVYFSRKINSLISISAVSQHPNWMYELSETGRLKPLRMDGLVTRRQDLRKLFIPNGAIYIREVKDFLASGKIIGDETFGFAMTEESSVDIDTEVDLMLAEQILINRIKE